MSVSTRILVVMLFATALSSCNRNADNIVAVRGRLTFQNKPVPGVQIHFQPEQGRGSIGLTDDQGHFETYYTRNRKGVHTGMNQLTITWDPSEDEDGNIAQPQEITRALLKHLRTNDAPKIEITSPQSNLEIALP